jgi:DNA-binding MarR family transcriptional regulator
MSTTNLQDNLNWLLIRSSMVVKHRLMKVSEEYNLTLMQALTICLLEPETTVPMSRISDLLACDPSNVTGIVERLSIGSYLERRESISDRRVKTIRLTDAGVALRSTLLPKVTDYVAAGTENLTQDEIARLKHLLRKTLPESNAKA